MESSIWTTGSLDSNKGLNHDLKALNTPKGETIISISMSWKSGYFITSTNHFYSWGCGNSWVLGTGLRADSPNPQLVTTFPNDYRFSLVVSGDKFAATLGEDGRVYVWGAGYAHCPTLVELQSPALHIACGSQKLICALEDGSVCIVSRKFNIQYFRISGSTIVKVAAGNKHFLALSDVGIAYSWGDTPSATGHTTEVNIPTRVPDLPFSIQSVYAYHENSWFLDINGSLFFCGSNTNGSLGIGHSFPVKSVQRHPFSFGDSQVIQVSCGDDFTLVLNNAGQVFGAGNNNDGRSMVPDDSLTNEFQLCTKLLDMNVTQISCGCFSSVILVKGAPPPDSGIVLITNFKEFCISQSSVSIVGPNRKRILLEPAQNLLFGYGLVIGDVLSDRRIEKDNQCMVIGGYENKVVIIKEVDCKIDFLDINSFHDLISKYYLIERSGSTLFTEQSSFGFSITIDSSNTSMDYFRGVLVGDMIDDYRVIAGSLGSHLFILFNQVLSEYPLSSIRAINRKGYLVEKRYLVDHQVYFIQVEQEFGQIFYNTHCGVCELFGYLGPKKCYFSPADHGELRILDTEGLLFRTNKSNTTTQCYLCSSDQILINIGLPDTSLYGFLSCDLTNTPDGIGTIIGLYQTKIAVILERNGGYFGCVRLYEPSSLRVIGRFNSPLKVQYNTLELSVNTSDFVDLGFFPGDHILIGDMDYHVVGVDEKGVGYGCHTNESELFPIVPPFKLIRRSMWIQGFEKHGDYIINVSTYGSGLSLHLPGDIISYNNNLYQFLGIEISDLKYAYKYIEKDTIVFNEYNYI